MTTLRIILFSAVLLGLASCSLNASITPPDFAEKRTSR